MEIVGKEEYLTKQLGKLNDWLQLRRKPKVPFQWNVSKKLLKTVSSRLPPHTVEI